MTRKCLVGVSPRIIDIYYVYYYSIYYTCGWLFESKRQVEAKLVIAYDIITEK